MNKPWIEHYPSGVPAELPAHSYRSLGDFLGEALAQHGDKAAFKFMGKTMDYRELDEASKTFAAYLQSIGLKPGDRIALMMPNVLQYPIAIAGVMRAGLVAVNTNPLYTPRELEHQLKDSGAKAIVILENMATTLEKCRKSVPVEHVIVASIGETLSPLKRLMVNFVVRRVKKMVPAYSLPGSITWTEAMSRGAKAKFTPVERSLDDVAVLQYTSGTTGPSKGATLTHGNVVANVLQSEIWNMPAVSRLPQDEQPHTVCALPLYHIFGFTVNMMLAMRMGGCNILITNPRDIPAVLKELQKHKFHLFPAVNTLFGAMARHPDAKKVDWSNLILSMGGGMAVQPATAKQWLDLTNCPVCEGYGLSETSPVASANDITSKAFTGTIGLPLPSTEMKIVDEDDHELPQGERGEIVIKGPQVMKGYWNRPEETAKAFTPDGFFKSGDIGTMDATGAFKIVDRKKDMINVSGFNVYPNEIEEVVTQMPGVTEAAAIGISDDQSGEAVKLFVVKSDPAITEEQVKTYCREKLTGYKRPKAVEFLPDLPKTNVGKILRRELRK